MFTAPVKDAAGRIGRMTEACSDGTVWVRFVEVTPNGVEVVTNELVNPDTLSFA